MTTFEAQVTKFEEQISQAFAQDKHTIEQYQRIQQECDELTKRTQEFLNDQTQDDYLQKEIQDFLSDPYPKKTTKIVEITLEDILALQEKEREEGRDSNVSDGKRKADSDPLDLLVQQESFGSDESSADLKRQKTES